MTQESPEQHADGHKPSVEKGGLWGLFFSAAGLLLPPYGIVLSVFGIVKGVQARRAAKDEDVTAPGAVTSMVVGAAGVLVSSALVAFLLVFSEEYTAYQECSARAHTVSSQNQCDEAWRSAVAERWPLPEGWVPPV